MTRALLKESDARAILGRGGDHCRLPLELRAYDGDG
jgi:hypothetical protein